MASGTASDCTVKYNAVFGIKGKFGIYITFLRGYLNF